MASKLGLHSVKSPLDYPSTGFSMTLFPTLNSLNVLDKGC